MKAVSYIALFILMPMTFDSFAVADEIDPFANTSPAEKQQATPKKLSERDEEHADDKSSKTVKLFSGDHEDEEGLRITLKKSQYPGVVTDKVDFEVLIENRLSEEVFVEVTDLEHALVSISGGGRSMITGASVTVFPNNISLLKRLHAATVSVDGKRSNCACGAVNVMQSANLNLAQWIGFKGTLSFKASGFYRSNGKKFCEIIDLPFDITDPSKSEQAGADQPASKPAEKHSVKDQPSTPTPKDGSR